MSVVALVLGALIAIAILIVVALVLFSAYTARRVVRALPPAGSFVQVDGSHIHYVEAGQGPPLLLIHGLAAQSATFTYALVDILKSDFRVVAVDRPGSGHSTRRSDAPAGIRAQARTMAGLIRALGLDRPVVAGHSLGGAIALALAVDHPALVSALALIAPVTQMEHTPPTAFRALAVTSALRRRLLSWTVAVPAAIRRSRAVLEMVFAPDPVPRDYAIAGGGLLGLRPSSFYATSSDLVAVNSDMPAILERYGSLHIPVGILFGRGDRILDYHRHGELTATQIPGARLELIDGGHMLPLSAPTRVAEFIREVARGAGAQIRATSAD